MTPSARAPEGDDELDPAALARARLYDLDLTDDPGDLDLYLALAGRTGDPILELGVGTGRLAVPLAAAGHRVVGVDVDRAMLARARSRATAAGVADRVRLVEADLRDVRLPDAGRYRLAFVALNTLLLLAERADQAAAVETLAAHLAPGGLAVVDVWLPDADDLGRFDGRLALEYVRREPSSGRLVAKLTSAVHDPVRATVELTTIHDEGAEGEPPVRWIRHDRLRLVGVDELVGFVESAGLRVEQLAGGYDLGPLGPGSERVVLVATRPE